MITIEEYFAGRDRLYPKDYTEEIQLNAQLLVDRVNVLLGEMARMGLVPEVSPSTGSCVSSGWRPPALNARVAGAALRSKHMIGQAIDLYDPEGVLDDWCMQYLPPMSHKWGLWMEHPSATKGWCHLQCVPPRSGNPVFYP